ncbi:MAG: DUF2628 domain-containing protein [bacterium]|nr:DUF2628 domain-containing protein [bacterium]
MERHYPPEVWNEAVLRWRAVPEADRGWYLEDQVRLPLLDEEFVVAHLADQIDIENGRFPTLGAVREAYSTATWTEAEGRWSSMTPDMRLNVMEGMVSRGPFYGVFFVLGVTAGHSSALDALWILLALGAAWWISSWRQTATGPRIELSDRASGPRQPSPSEASSGDDRSDGQCSYTDYDTLADKVELVPNVRSEAIAADELETFIGLKKDYYIRQWAVPGSMSFNWAAFFFGICWLGYRKMYATAAIVIAVLLLETVVEDLVIVNVLGAPQAAQLIGYAVAIALSLVCGWLGNRWYFRRAIRVIAEVRRSAPDENAHSRRLARRGGTSAWGPVLVALMLLLGLFISAFVVPSPAMYADVSSLDPAKIGEISITLEGVIYFNGVETTAEQLLPELRKLSEMGGGVLYYRAGGSDPPWAAEQAGAKVMWEIGSAGLPVEWSDELAR